MKLDEWEANRIFGSKTTVGADRFLFHYTSVERAAAIALTGAIALAPLGPMNDPRESQLRQVTTVRSGGREGAPPVTDADREAYEEALWRLRGRVRLACLTQDRMDGESAMLADSRGFAHSRMWAQYGAAHTGVCIVFDRQALIEDAQTRFGPAIHHDEVKYIAGFDQALALAEMVDFDFPDPKMHHVAHVVPSLFVKNIDWQSELEYRIIVDDWGVDPCLLPVARSIQGLAFGVGFQPHNLPIIDAFARKFGITDHISQIMVNCGVLQAWPARDRHGKFRVWTDADTRSYEEIFDRG